MITKIVKLIHNETMNFLFNRDDSLTSKRVIMRTEQQTKCFEQLQKCSVLGAIKTDLSSWN